MYFYRQGSLIHLQSRTFMRLRSIKKSIISMMINSWSNIGSQGSRRTRITRQSSRWSSMTSYVHRGSPQSMPFASLSTSVLNISCIHFPLRKLPWPICRSKGRRFTMVKHTGSCRGCWRQEKKMNYLLPNHRYNGREEIPKLPKLRGRGYTENSCWEIA